MKAIIRRRSRSRKRRIERRLDRSHFPDDCSQPVLRSGPLKFQLAGRAVGTAYGGIGLMQQLVRELQLAEAIDERLHLFKAHRPYHESDHVLNLAYNVLCDGRCLDDLELRRQDEAYLDLLGATRMTQRFADALTDARTGDVRHSNRSLTRQRIYGILADYEDQNDHDTLRSDPIFKLVCDRPPDGRDLASQPTLSRFENAVTIADLKRLRDVQCDQFLDAFTTPPSRITLDIDAFDDPAHGRQQLIAFHGYYEQYQYLPIAITCAETDAVALVGLRHGTCAAFLGADDDLRYLARRIRERFPDVEIVVRGDSGFGVPLMYDVCAELGLGRETFCAPPGADHRSTATCSPSEPTSKR